VLVLIHKVSGSVRTVNFLVLAYLFVTFAAKVKLTATITISRQHQFASF